MTTPGLGKVALVDYNSQNPQPPYVVPKYNLSNLWTVNWKWTPVLAGIDLCLSLPLLVSSKLQLSGVPLLTPKSDWDAEGTSLCIPTDGLSGWLRSRPRWAPPSLNSLCSQTHIHFNRARTKLVSRVLTPFTVWAACLRKPNNLSCPVSFLLWLS